MFEVSTDVKVPACDAQFVPVSVGVHPDELRAVLEWVGGLLGSKAPLKLDCRSVGMFYRQIGLTPLSKGVGLAVAEVY